MARGVPARIRHQSLERRFIWSRFLRSLLLPYLWDFPFRSDRRLSQPVPCLVHRSGQCSVRTPAGVKSSGSTERVRGSASKPDKSAISFKSHNSLSCPPPSPKHLSHSTSSLHHLTIKYLLKMEMPSLQRGSSWSSVGSMSSLGHMTFTLKGKISWPACDRKADTLIANDSFDCNCDLVQTHTTLLVAQVKTRSTLAIRPTRAWR